MALDQVKQGVKGQLKRGIAFITDPKRRVFVIIISFALVGAIALLATQAATPTAFFEAEGGTRSSCMTNITNTSASGGAAVRFCDGSPVATSSPGAHLPIDYSLSSLTGTVRYVAASGGSDSNAGTQGAPFATVAKAINVSAANDTIVVRGGTYREGGIILNKSGLRLIAYPKETPIFTGSVAIGGGTWTTDGNYRYKIYTPMEQPKDGDQGISWITNKENLNSATNYIGASPDQVWINGVKLQQKPNLTDVTDSTFYVDRTNNRLYVSATNATKADVEVTNKQKSIKLSATGVIVEGIRMQRYAACLHSSTACQESDLSIDSAASNAMARNVEVLDSAYIGVKSANNNGVTLKNVTVNGSNWMGINATLTQNVTLDGVVSNYHNSFQEFTSSPQSGGLKTSRTWYTKVLNSDVSNNKSHGIWFDQSNYNMEVVNTTITNNTGAGIFFEISDGLLLANSYIANNGGDASLKLAGSSGIKLVNNTVVGSSRDLVGIYIDSRSQPGCSTDISKCNGAQSWSSDRGAPGGQSLPATMTWMPSVDLWINNVIGYPSTTAGYCGGVTPVCAMLSRTEASVAPEYTFHKADSLRPQTIMDNNVYVNTANTAIFRIKTSSSTQAYTVPQLTSYFGGTPVGIPGLEDTSLSGTSWFTSDGTPTAALAAKHGEAYAVPSTITSKYPALATKHYGVLWK